MHTKGNRSHWRVFNCAQANLRAAGALEVESSCASTIAACGAFDQESALLWLDGFEDAKQGGVVGFTAFDFVRASPDCAFVSSHDSIAMR
jgi:hypothetical protein